jgi:hypothetical protein
LMEIAEVEGLDYEHSPSFPSYRLRRLYQFEFAHSGCDGKEVGRFTVCEIPTWLRDLHLVPNYRVPHFWKQ